MHSHELEITKYDFLLKTIYLELIRIFYELYAPVRSWIDSVLEKD